MANETIELDEMQANLTRIRLVDKFQNSISGYTEGRLEIRPRGQALWGTVCNEVCKSINV